MAKRQFLQLAHVYRPKRNGIAGWFVSEKLDGIRCFWDGGVSRGIPKEEVPWSNMVKDKSLHVSTGMWSRYGNVIHAPDWFLDQLPKFPLDGELWVGRRKFQTLTSIVKRHEPDDRWKRVKFMVLDAINYETIFETGVINTINFEKQLDEKEIMNFMGRNTYENINGDFEHNLRWLRRNLIGSKNIEVLQQEYLPYSTEKAHARIEEMLNHILELGGEGLIVRKPEAIWLPERTYNVLKIKPFADSEGIVKDYIWGREGKLDGLMGALVVQWQGKEFELSGFTDHERYLVYKDTRKGASSSSIVGEDVDQNITNELFPRGSSISFRYRELSDAGIPKEARYLRKE